MNTSESKHTATKGGKASDAPLTRRGRLPGPETGFGKRLREARGIQTQAEVAERAEIARSAYARYETGGRYPSVPELRRLCEALSATPEHLIFGESGPGFRPPEESWALELRDICAESGVAFFWKQWGGFTPKAGGRLLGGREWNEYPLDLVTQL